MGSRFPENRETKEKVTYRRKGRAGHLYRIGSQRKGTGDQDLDLMHIGGEGRGEETDVETLLRRSKQCAKPLQGEN